jgi:hypothetical protein
MRVTRKAPATRVFSAVAGAVFLAAAALAPGAAHAAPGASVPPPLSETLTGDALRDYQSARELLLYHDDLGALVRFARLYDQLHDARLLANMALCEKELGHHARAATLFRRALDEGAALFAPEQLAQLGPLLDASLALSGRVRVSVGLVGAAIAIDERPVGGSPLAADVLIDPGLHRIRVSRAGYRDWTRDVAVTAAGSGGRNVTLVDVVLEPDTRDSVVRVVTAPGNAVSLDGRPISIGSGQARVAPGSHALAVTADGMAPFHADLSLREGETRTVDVTLNEDRRAKVPVWLWVAGGAVVGVAVIVAGASVFHSSDTHAAAGSVASPLRVSW